MEDWPSIRHLAGRVALDVRIGELGRLGLRMGELRADFDAILPLRKQFSN